MGFLITFALRFNKNCVMDYLPKEINYKEMTSIWNRLCSFD